MASHRPHARPVTVLPAPLRLTAMPGGEPGLSMIDLSDAVQRQPRQRYADLFRDVLPHDAPPVYAGSDGPDAYRLGRVRPEVEQAAWYATVGARLERDAACVYLALSVARALRAIRTALKGVG